MIDVNDYRALSLLTPTQNELCIAGTDKADIVLANVLTGLSFAEPLPERKVVIDGGEHPVIAIPALDIDIEDKKARQMKICWAFLLMKI